MLINLVTVEILDGNRYYHDNKRRIASLKGKMVCISTEFRLVIQGRRQFSITVTLRAYLQITTFDDETVDQELGTNGGISVFSDPLFLYFEGQARLSLEILQKGGDLLVVKFSDTIYFLQQVLPPRANEGTSLSRLIGFFFPLVNGLANASPGLGCHPGQASRSLNLVRPTKKPSPALPFFVTLPQS